MLGLGARVHGWVRLSGGYARGEERQRCCMAFGGEINQLREGSDCVDTESFQLLYLYNSSELKLLLKQADLYPFQALLHTVPLFFLPL